MENNLLGSEDEIKLMERCKKHKYRIVGKTAECLFCGHTKKATKPQLEKVKKIHERIERKFIRALSRSNFSTKRQPKSIKKWTK